MPHVVRQYEEETGRKVLDDFPEWEPCHRAILSQGICGIENVGGDIDKVTGMRVTFAAFPWRWKEGRRLHRPAGRHGRPLRQLPDRGRRGMKPSEIFEVAGKSALIAGASGAFGAVAAWTLAEAGCRLTLTGGNSGSAGIDRRKMPRALEPTVATVNARPDTETGRRQPSCGQRRREPTAVSTSWSSPRA